MSRPLPFFLFAIGALLAAPAASEGIGAREDAYVDSDASRSMAALVDSGFSGSVLVACGDTILFEGDYGVPLDNGRTPSYWLASITKQFTAAGILRLAEIGRLSLEDRVDRFFPEATGPIAGATIGQLLTHTSGLPNDYVADQYESIDEAAAALFAVPLERAPGGAFGYTNDGYALLAMIAERAAGEPFEHFMAREILRPAGMIHVGYAGEPVEPQSIVPSLLDDRTMPATWGFRGPTGLRASTRDLFRWVRALADGTVISAESAARMTSRQVTRESGEGVGYNWFLFDEDGRRWINTRGYEDNGANAVIQVDPATSLTIVTLTHAGPAEDSDAPPWSRTARTALVEAFSDDTGYRCDAGPWPG